MQANRDALAVREGARERSCGRRFVPAMRTAVRDGKATSLAAGVDECAHRAMHNLKAATNAVPRAPSLGDKQWKTERHIADSQRLTAGFIVLFFEKVGFPIDRVTV